MNTEDLKALLEREAQKEQGYIFGLAANKAAEDAQKARNQLLDLAPQLVQELIEARELLGTIARMTLDGEQDDSGEVFEMDADDAFDTVNKVVELARNLIDKHKPK